VKKLLTEYLLRENPDVGAQTRKDLINGTSHKVEVK
jgi:hypothetical protein